MKGDDFIARVLAHGRYQVDLEQGVVVGRHGRALKGALDKDGYVSVTLFFKRGEQYTARVHRIVAIQAWGVASVTGRQVAHLDQNKTNNAISNLWLPESVKEHNEYDGTGRNLLLGQEKCKESWPPCVRCLTPDGKPFHARKTPARVRGQRFGFDGDLCWGCYHALHERERRARRKAAK